VRFLVIAVALLAAAGCDDTRPDPAPPTAEITLAANGGYLLDGRPVSPDRLNRELSRRAAEAPNEKLGRTRLHVIIRQAPGIEYQRVLDLQERCQSLGISQVEVPR